MDRNTGIVLKSYEDLVHEEFSSDDIEMQQRARSLTYDQTIRFLASEIQKKEDPETRNRRQLIERLAKDFAYWRTAIPRPAVKLVSWSNLPVIHLNTLNVIAGDVGSCKSRLGHSFLSAVLSPSGSLPQLDLESSETESVVMLIDTEHNEDQLIGVRDRILRLAGFDCANPPDNFFISSLNCVDGKLAALTDRIKYLNLLFPDTHKVIMIDTITDLVGDYNNLTDSLAIANKLNGLLRSANCTFICVIHEVQGNNYKLKPRGHVGNEILNKATTSLSIKKTGNRFQLNFTKFRIGKLPGGKQLEFCELSQGLRITDENETAPSRMAVKKTRKTGRPRKIDDTKLKNLIAEVTGTGDSTTFKQIKDRLSLEFGCTSKAIEGRLKVLPDSFEIQGKRISVSQKEKVIRSE
jgi:hypothetical protein